MMSYREVYERWCTDGYFDPDTKAPFIFTPIQPLPSVFWTPAERSHAAMPEQLKPMDIEARSFEIITELLGDLSLIHICCLLRRLRQIPYRVSRDADGQGRRRHRDGRLEQQQV